MDYDRAKSLAEEALFEWYGQEQGWYDSLPVDAIEALEERVARKILEAVFEATGGRGVALAEEIDRARRKKV